jgi:hypothetical protein
MRKRPIAKPSLRCTRSSIYGRVNVRLNDAHLPYLRRIKLPTKRGIFARTAEERVGAREEVRGTPRNQFLHRAAAAAAAARDRAAAFC